MMATHSPFTRRISPADRPVPGLVGKPPGSGDRRVRSWCRQAERQAATVCLGTVSALCATELAAGSAQRECVFTFVSKITNQNIEKADVNLRVRMIHNARSGGVIVTGSGDQKARAETSESGAVDYVFNTDVSRETITISPSGDTLLDIRFKNSDLMVYVGTCRDTEVIS